MKFLLNILHAIYVESTNSVLHSLEYSKRSQLMFSETPVYVSKHVSEYI